VTEEKLSALRTGIFVNGVKKYCGMQAKIVSQSGHNAWLSISLFEGKNRQIRDALQQLHLKVSRIIRVQYGPYSLGSLPQNAVKELKITPQIWKNAQLSVTSPCVQQNA
jgi:23S rRNA pseudouridine2605 synthase